MRLHASIAPVVGLLLLASPLSAQDRGVWFSAGLGSGAQRVACDICRGDHNGGWAARLALGRRLGPKLSLGAEIHGWTDEAEGIRYRAIAVLPAVYWRPTTRGNWFLIGGAGHHLYKASDDNETLSSSGLAATFGVGIDVPLTGRFRLTPFATYTASFLATLKHDRTDITNAQLTLLQAGFGLTRR